MAKTNANKPKRNLPPRNTPDAAVPQKVRAAAPNLPKNEPAAPKSALEWQPFVLAVVVLGLFATAFSNGFVDWDDPTYVAENPLVANPTWANFYAMLYTPISLNYHPLTMWSLQANELLFGASPRSFIVTNVLLHVANVVLAYYVVRRLVAGAGGSEKVYNGMAKAVAFWVALLWAIHPLRVESVAWVSERKDVLYVFFFLLGVRSYLRQRDTGRAISGAYAFAFFVLSCLSKAVAVVFPLVLLLIDWWETPDFWKPRTHLNKLPYFAVSLVVGLVAVNVQGGGNFYGLMAATETKKALGGEVFSLLQKLQFAGYGFMNYIVKLFAPTSLSNFYPYPSLEGANHPIYTLALVGMLLVLGVAAWAVVRGGTYLKPMAFGVGFYFVTVALVLQFVAVGKVIVADRYTYLPHLGLVFMFVCLLFAAIRTMPQWRVGVQVVLGVAAAVLMYRTSEQIKVWSDTDSLWANAIAVYPNEPQLYVTRGTHYGKEGKYKEAMADLERARDMGYKEYQMYESLGNGYASLGRMDEALRMFNAGIAIDSTQGNGFYNRGLVNLNHDLNAAIHDFNKALSLNPIIAPEIRNSRALAYLNLNQLEPAIADFTFAIEHGRVMPDNYFNRGLAYVKANNKAAAIADLQKTIQLKPDYEKAKRLLEDISRQQ